MLVGGEDKKSYQYNNKIIQLPQQVQNYYYLFLFWLRGWGGFSLGLDDILF